MANFFELCSGLGLNDRETKVLEILLQRGPQTMVECARLTQIPRTQVYRITESLEKHQLVKRVIDEHRQIIQAEPIDRLKAKLTARRKQLESLEHTLPDILQSLSPQNTSPTSVKYYRGTEGVSQLVWHITESKSEVVGYTYRDLAQVDGKDFAEDVYLEFIRRRTHIRDIYSDSYIESVGGKANAIKPEIAHPDWVTLCTSRYLPASKLPISHQMDIYDNTVAFYNWHEGDIFGVEIENPKVATFQRSLFELVWSQARPV
jgi:DNA-binding MarR family transcriptional regulator